MAEENKSQACKSGQKKGCNSCADCKLLKLNFCIMLINIKNENKIICICISIFSGM